MNTSNYYKKAFDLHMKLGTLVASLNEVRKIISPSPKAGETFLDLNDTILKDKQLELLKNAWIILAPINRIEFGSDIKELVELLGETENCPVGLESEIHGFNFS